MREQILSIENGIHLYSLQILGRTLRVDHVKEYKVPKDNDKVDDLTRELWREGCAPTTKFGGGQNPNQDPESDDHDYLAPPPPPLALPSSSKSRDDKQHPEKRKHSSSKDSKKSKKSKKEKKKKKKKDHKKKSRRDSSSSSGSDSD